MAQVCSSPRLALPSEVSSSQVLADEAVQVLLLVADSPLALEE